MKIDKELRAKIKADWDEPILSAAQIAAKYGVTKNQVIGLSKNHNWCWRREPPPIPDLNKRMQLLENQMDNVLVQTALALK